MRARVCACVRSCVRFSARVYKGREGTATLEGKRRNTCVDEAAAGLRDDTGG